MGKIIVKRHLHVEQPGVLEEAMVTSVGYVSKDRNVLMECVQYGGQRGFYFCVHGQAGQYEARHVVRRSEDNGRTWTKVEDLARFRPIEGRRRLEVWEPNFVVHPKSGALMRVYQTNEDLDGVLAWDKASPVPRTGRVWTQVSVDEGKTWSETEQVIVQGGEYDATHWAPGVWYDTNSGGVEGFVPVWTTEEEFVVPFVCQPRRGPDDTQRARSHSGCLIGRWRAGETKVSWSIPSLATVGPAYSNCGADEPSVALLPDGRLAMTLRVRVDPNDGTTLPSGKFIATSRDLGRTWDEPQPLKYTDGEQVYCPACLANVFVSSRNRRVYLVTNILDRPTHGCDPRTSLQIAELDPGTLRVIRDSVTVIETRRPDQLETIRFSNWRWYEDRKTKNIVLLMTGCPGNQGRHETCRVPPHSYRYDLILPD